MNMLRWLKVSALAMGLAGLGVVVKDFLPQRLPVYWQEPEPAQVINSATMPEIEIVFLRCGIAEIPEFLTVRGATSIKRRFLAHSAVLIRHPQATFLYDTGLCTDIYRYLEGQSWLFRNTLGKFHFERSLQEHLKLQGLNVQDVDFVLLSHLHWDHVSGIPDIAGVPLRIHKVEYDAARLKLMDQHKGLVRRLLGDANPVELFEMNGGAYEGFRASHDVFGDGSIVLVPLPGHTAGNTGMFINRSNGSRVFLIGDAAWVADNYLRPATMHPWFWSAVSSDDATGKQTLVDIYKYASKHPEVPIIAMHDAQLQEAFMKVERNPPYRGALV